MRLFSRLSRPASLLARAGRAHLETLEPRIVLSATADVFHAPLYLHSGSTNTLTDVAVGDINGDGLDDVVVADGSSNIRVIRSSRGAYLAPVSLASGLPTADRVALADLDGDGDLDIAALDAQGAMASTDSDTSTFINNGFGVFGAANVLNFPLFTVTDWAVTDFSGDGLPDFIFLSDDRVRGYAGDGAGGFNGGTIFSQSGIGSGNRYLDVGDIDGDGILDVAFISSSASTIYIKLGTGGGGAAAADTSLAFAGTAWAGFALVDTSGNGKIDYFAAVEDDGDLLAIGNFSTPGSLLGDSSPLQSNGVGVGIQNLVAADLNGDGLEDLVAASPGNNTYIAWFANADPAVAFFDTSSYFYSNESIARVAVGDSNGDGRVDLFGVSSRTVIVHPNLGNGVYTAIETTPGGTVSGLAEQPTQAIYGDLDGDGDDDAVLFQNTNDDNFRIYVSTLGRFAVDVHDIDTDFDGGILNGTIVDINGDGRQEIVLIGHAGGQTAVEVFFNLGDLNFTSLGAGVIANGTLDIGHVWGGTLNGGNKGDVVVADYTSNRLIFLAGMGNGNVSVANRVRLGVTPNHFAVADMDADTDNDIVIATPSGVSVLVEDGNFSYTSLITSVYEGGARAVAVGQFNPDSRPDVAAIVGDGYGELTFLRNQSTTPGLPFLKQLPQSSVLLGNATFDRLLVGDLDGDGNQDFVLAGENSTIFATFLGDGFLGVDELGWYEADNSSPNSWGYGLTDLDRDGDLDVLMLTSFSDLDRRGIAIFRAYGDGTFVYPEIAANSIGTARVPVPPVGVSSKAYATADFNNDGRIDFAVAEEGYDASFVSIFLNTGLGFERAALVSPGFADPSDLVGSMIAAGDVTGDGRADVIIYNQSESRFYTLVNAGDGRSFSVMLAHSQSDFGYDAVALRDMTGDGFLDIVAVDTFSENVVIMPGKNDGTFRNGAVRIVVNVPDITTAFNATPLIFDADGDGALDFAVWRQLGGGNYDVRLHRQANPSLYQFSTVWSGTDLPSTNLSASDIDGDGREEILFSNTSTSAPMLFIGFNLSTPGSPSFTTLSYSLPRPGELSTGAFAADVDLDGRKEILVTGFGGTTIVELNAAGAPLASVAVGVSTAQLQPGLWSDLDGDGDPDLIASSDFSNGSGVAIYTNRLLGVSRVSNVAPAIPGGPIWLSPQVAGSTVNISYEQFLALSGVTDADGDEVRFRVVQIVNGTLMGPGGIISGNNTFRPGTSVSYTAPLGPVGGSAVAFRVRVLDPFTESSVVISVRVPVLGAPLMQPPAPSESEDEGPGWLAFEGLDFGLFADPAEPAVRI